MHRDISIGNMLKLLRPTKRNAFHIRHIEALSKALALPLKDFKESTVLKGVHRAVNDKATELCKAAEESADSTTLAEKKWGEIYLGFLPVEKMAKGVMEKVAELNVTDYCKAIVTDGDLAAYVPTYFTKPHEAGTISVRKLLRSCIYFS